MLSGTSMAAPLVAGAVARMLERQPTLTPRQVKQRLVSTAAPLAFGTPVTRGAGMLDALAAVGSSDTTSWNDASRPSDGFAQLVLPLIVGSTITWTDLTFNGGVDSSGVSWSSVTWDAIVWDDITWNDITWDDVTWDDITWDSVAAQDITWETGLGPLGGSGGWSVVK